MKKMITNDRKAQLVVYLVFLIFGKGYAQIQMSPTASVVDGSATLEIKSGPYASGSPYRGLLAPIVTTTQRGQIQNPAIGLIIFNSTSRQIEVNTGTTAAPVWTPGGAVSTGGSSAGAWSLLGNAGTITGTNFLGTTDNVALNFRVNNQNAGRIDPILNNVGLGYFALSTGTTGQGNTALGTFTLFNNTSSNYNTAAGFKSLFSATTGDGNTAVGAVALQANTAGHDNAALGAVALTANITGNYNTAAGAGALQNNTSGSSNTAMGHNAGAANTTGYAIIGIGEDALIRNVDGHDNVAVGVASLSNNTSGNGNTASGNLALRLTTTGQNNTAAGLLALQYNTTGNNNTGLGYNAGPLSGNPSLSNATAIGANAIVNASNTIVLGDNNIAALRCNVQTISTLSDKRIKEDIQANVPGLRFITRLNPVTYHVNKFKEAKLVGYPLSNVKQDRTVHSGFLAQDVELAAKEVGYDFGGVRQEEGGKYYTLGYTLFVIPLVQAVKDLNEEVESLKARLQKSETVYNQLADQVRHLQELVGTPKAETASRTEEK
jgi:hypothetical protein